MKTDYQRKYAARRENGKCGKCGNDPQPGRTQCSDCLSRSADNYWKRYGQGKCVTCGGGLPETEARTQCDDCRVRHGRAA